MTTMPTDDATTQARQLRHATRAARTALNAAVAQLDELDVRVGELEAAALTGAPAAASVPAKAAVLPDESAAVPADSARLPYDSAALPDDSVALPDDSVALPDDSAAPAKGDPIVLTRPAAGSQTWRARPPESVPQTLRPAVLPPAPTSSGQVSQASSDRSSTELRLGQLGLLVGGVITALFGVGYFLKYSFDQQWIGPLGRVLLAFAGGGLTWAIGEGFVRRGLPVFGRWLIGGAIAALYFASYASFQIYELVGQGPAFVMMAAVTIAAVMLALRHDHRGLAVMGVIGGYATPLMLSTGAASFTSLMTYLAMLGLGVLWLASHKRWRILTRLSFGLSWTLFLGFYVTQGPAESVWLTVGFAQLFFLLHAAAPFVYFWRRRTAGPTHVADFAVALASSLLAFLVSWDIIEVSHRLEGTAFAGWSAALALFQGAAFLVMAYLARRANPDHQNPFVLSLLAAVSYGVLAVPLALDGAWVTILWAAQGAACMAAALRLGNRRLFLGAIALLALATLKWAGMDLPLFVAGDGYAGDLSARWATALSLVGTFVYVARSIGRVPAHFTRRAMQRVAYAAAAAVGFVFANIEVSELAAQSFAAGRGAAISVLWATAATALMIVGFWLRDHFARRAALVLYCVTAAKVFFFDLARLETPYRVASFLALGVLMVGASYLYHRYRHRLGPSPAAAGEA